MMTQIPFYANFEPQKGREGVPVTLVVFTDFECIHCSTWAETLNTVLKTFPEDVKIVFKNYPIPYHKHAQLAAKAALAAGEQGKFWEMHDLLFKNYNALGKEDITGYAKSLGLNLSKFEKSLKSKEINDKINQDRTQGKGLGVQNAPTTFVNGRKLVGSPPFSYIKGLIEDILENRNIQLKRKMLGMGVELKDWEYRTKDAGFLILDDILKQELRD